MSALGGAAAGFVSDFAAVPVVYYVEDIVFISF